MKKYKVILNPKSGKGKGESALDEVDKQLTTMGLDYDMVLTEKEGHAVSLAREAAIAGYDVVVAAGGDGTANEVLNGLMEAKKKGVSDLTMGIICVGRGNDFAYGMGIPDDMKNSCAVLAHDYRKAVDVGRVKGGYFPEGRFFGNGVGVGFDAVVGFEAEKLKVSGFLGYLIAALKTIFLYFKAPHVEVLHDKGKLDLNSLMVSVMNGRRLGGGFMMAPDGKVDDGELNICIAQQVSKLGIFGLIGKFMSGTQNSHKAITTFRTRSLTVKAIEGTLPAHADGETLSYEATELSMEILPAQIQIVCEEGSE
jgi:YegS/Rv2252/BmrU family lipid kinase